MTATIRLLAFLIALTMAVSATPASAQTGDERDVTIDFEVGDFDSSQADWPVTVVNVSGDLERDEVFVVELRAGDGEIVWAGEGVFSPPTTSVTVDTFVGVGDVDEAAIGQRLPEETTATAPPAVAGNVVTNPTTPPTTAPPTPAVTEPPAPAQPPPPTVEGDVTAAPDVPLPRQGSGLGGAGQLALSMVIAVVFVAILFRTPLPSATTQRWRR